MIDRVLLMTPISLEGLSLEGISLEDITLEDITLEDIIHVYKEKLLLIVENKEEIINTLNTYEIFNNLIHDFIEEALKTNNSETNLRLILGFIEEVFKQFNLIIGNYITEYKQYNVIIYFINNFLNITIKNIQVASNELIEFKEKLEKIIVSNRHELFTKTLKETFKEFLKKLYSFKLLLIKTEKEVKFYLDIYIKNFIPFSFFITNNLNTNKEITNYFRSHKKPIPEDVVLTLQKMKQHKYALKQFKLNVGLIDKHLKKFISQFAPEVKSDNSETENDEMIEKMAELFIFHQRGQFTILQLNIDMLINTVIKLLFPLTIRGGNLKRKAIRKILKKYK